MTKHGVRFRVNRRQMRNFSYIYTMKITRPLLPEMLKLQANNSTK